MCLTHHAIQPIYTHTHTPTPTSKTQECEEVLRLRSTGGEVFTERSRFGFDWCDTGTARSRPLSKLALSTNGRAVNRD